jgi:hypothetical protein
LLISFAVAGPSEDDSHAMQGFGLTPTDVKAIGAE